MSLDETQDVARAYGAVCTPDFFGFDRDLTLAYRGRLDARGARPIPTAPRELFDAMVDDRAQRQGARGAAPVGRLLDQVAGLAGVAPLKERRSASSTASGSSAISAWPQSGSVDDPRTSGKRRDQRLRVASAAP